MNLRRYVWLALTLVLGPAALAAPWALVESPQSETLADFRPELFSESGADGFWALGDGPGDGAVAVKFDLSGSLVARASNDRFALDQAAPKRLADGGALVPGVAEDSAFGCVLSRLTSDGRLLWQTRIQKDDPDDAERCQRIELDAADGIWVQLGTGSFQRIAHLRMDGSIAGVIETAGVFGRVTQVRADPIGAGVYLAGDLRVEASGVSQGRAQIIRYGGDHSIAWRWETANAASDTGTLLMEVSANRGILALYSFFAAEDRGNTHADWVAVGLALDGQARFERTLHFDRAVSLLQMSPLDALGSWLVINDPATETTPAKVAIARLSLAGNLAASHPIANTSACRQIDCPLALRSDAGLWLNTTPVDGTGNFILVGLDAAGSERARIDNVGMGLSLLPDGRAVTGSRATTPAQALRAGFNQPTEPWPNVLALLPDRMTLRREALASDGGRAEFGSFAGRRLVLRHRAGPSATASWQVAWDATLLDDLETPQLSISATLVCLATEISNSQQVAQGLVGCWRRSDGSLFWQGNGLLDNPNTSKRIMALADGRVVTVISDNQRLAMYRMIDASGQVSTEVPIPNASGFMVDASIRDNGEALLLAFGNSGNVLHLLEVGGAERFQLPIASGSPSVVVRFANDGGAMLMSSSVQRVSAAGTPLWQHQLSAFLWDAVFGDDTLWLSLRRSAANPADDLVALDMATGQQRWSHDLRGRSNERPQIELGAGNRLMVLQSQRSRLRWRVYDGADGTLLQEQTDGCAAVLCDLIRLRPGADGSALAWLDTFSAADGWGASLVRLPDAVADVGRIAADQDGVSGAWFAPWSNGQGLVIDWIAGARTLFAPWFTFSPSDPDTFFDYRTSADSDAANLHWFTLQGVVAPGATRADLALLSTDGGDFGVGIANARQVGDASLEFESCDRAHLRYRFNAEVNAGAEGLITLTRLTPGAPCVGNTGVAAAPKRFDASFEGSWFDPASSGQGLMFSVIPALDTLFATWFTYDPAAAPDEASEQHWFTLQGPLGDGEQTTLAIVRTLGGSFDELPTSNTQRVGTATVTRLACDRAELSYQFDDSEIAAAFRGIGGSQILTRIGGCE